MYKNQEKSELDSKKEQNVSKASAQKKNKNPEFQKELQLKELAQRKNNTGLPDNLKSGIENMSGYSMDDVKVHYNSSKPAQLNAHAYAQGNQIHLGGGQEKHLAHEAWHVVQQKQGRVKPTMNVGGAAVNDDVALEKEADVMGGKALQMKKYGENTLIISKEPSYDGLVIQGQFFRRLFKATAGSFGFYTAGNLLARKYDTWKFENSGIKIKEYYKPKSTYKLTLRAYEAFDGMVSIGNLKANHVWLQLDDDVLVQRGNGKPDQTKCDEIEEIEISGEQANYLRNYQEMDKIADYLYFPVINDCHTRIKDAQKVAELDKPLSTGRFT